jgi:tyrosyl-tRNA synthetase
MSKSLGNAIGITDPPAEMFGKVMSVSDSLMLDYFDLLADDRWDDLRPLREALGRGDGDPMEFKLALARALVGRFAGVEAAESAATHFRDVIQRKQVPTDLEEVVCPTGDAGEMGLLELLDRLDLVDSRSQARRLVDQKAVRIDGEVVADPAVRLTVGSYLLKVGKRRFAKVRLS